MATSVLQAFREFGQNLEITDLQATTVSTRQQNVRAAVEKRLSVLDSFLTGSYRRHTMIAPLKEADVDVFVVLSSSHFERNGQAALLERVRQVLRETYPETPRISPNGQAVTISFTDFEVDVVPGFGRQGGGYLIPDSTKSRWIETDPKRHVDIWAEANKVHNGDLVPIMKMLKAWNRAHSATLRSFHLEVLVLQTFDRVTISDYPSGARFFFDKARTRELTTAPDPAGYGDAVGGYLDSITKIHAVVERLETAYTRAREAERFDGEGRTRAAVEKWQTIFGDYFPAYG